MELDLFNLVRNALTEAGNAFVQSIGGMMGSDCYGIAKINGERVYYTSKQKEQIVTLSYTEKGPALATVTLGDCRILIETQDRPSSNIRKFVLDIAKMAIENSDSPYFD